MHLLHPTDQPGADQCEGAGANHSRWRNSNSLSAGLSGPRDCVWRHWRSQQRRSQVEGTTAEFRYVGGTEYATAHELSRETEKPKSSGSRNEFIDFFAGKKIM